MAVRWLARRTGIAQQALHAYLRFWARRRSGAHSGTPPVSLAVALGQPRRCPAHIPPESSLEHSQSLSFPGTASEYSARRSKRSTQRTYVFRSGSRGHASSDGSNLAIGRVVLFFPPQRKGIPSFGLGMCHHLCAYLLPQSAHLLPLAGVSFADDGRKRSNRLLALPPASRLAENCVPGLHGGARRVAGAHSSSCSAA